MTVTLCVTSFQGKSLGANRCKTFAETGGTLGRAENNDWVLPDPQRVLSSHHAALSLRNGRYYLLDTSTNGVFVNESATAVGKGNSVELHDGDRLTMGVYQFNVSMGQAAITAPSQLMAGLFSESGAGAPDADQLLRDLLGPDTGPELGMIPPRPSPPPRPAAPPAARPATEADHVSAVESYFEPPSAKIELRIPENWDNVPEPLSPVAQPSPDVPRPPPRVAEMPPVMPQPTPPATMEAEPIAIAVPAPAPPAPRYTAAAPVASANAEAPSAESAALQTLLRGAGIEGLALNDAQAAELLESFGKIMREVVAGVMEVLLARASLKSEFRMSMTMIRPVENNPLKFSVNVDEAMRHLLMQHERGYLPAVEAFEQAFDDIKHHQMAMIAGMRAAYENLLRRFDPVTLEEKFERLLRAGIVLPGTRKLRYWDLYVETYQELAKDAEDNFQRLFGEEFARAYEEQMRLLGSRQTPR